MTPVARFHDFALLGMLASGYAAVAGSGFLDPLAAWAGGLILAARLAQLLFVRAWTPPASWVNLAAAGYALFFLLDWQYLSRDFLQATVHLLFFVAGVRLLTARTMRDARSVQLIALLEIVAAAVLSGSTTFFAALAAFLVFAIATFASGEIRRSAETAGVRAMPAAPGASWRLAGLTVAIAGGVLLLGGLMFFALPRTARAAFQHLVPDSWKVAGFANEVTLGRLTDFQRLDTPVLHVRVFSGDGRLPSLKWRGAALTRFDGRRWFAPPEPSETLRQEQGLFRLADNAQRWRAGRRLSYEVVPRALRGDTLFLAGTAEFVAVEAPSLERTATGTLRAPGLGGPRYSVYAFLEESATPPAAAASLSPVERAAHLALPPLDARIPALARDWGSPESIERRFRAEFRYTLQRSGDGGSDPLAHFLFEERAGHCEYFASAMAVLLRANGIPARVVTGFQAGAFNPISGWQVIRAADAHSWVEAWIDGRGWVTYDPTPADPSAPRDGLRQRLALWADALDTFWQEWVLNYNLERQLSLAARAEQKRFSWSLHWVRRLGDELLAIAPVLVGGMALLYLLSRLEWRRLRRRGASPTEAGELYRQLLTRLRHKGFEKPAWITPAEWVEQLPAADWKPHVERFTRLYNECRFGGSAAAAAEMRDLLRHL